MKSLCIVSPTKIVGSSASGNSAAATYARALTPDPKEAWRIPSVSTAQTYVLYLDLGSVKAIDSAFVGYQTDTSGGVTYALAAINGPTGSITSYVFTDMNMISPGYGPPVHGFNQGNVVSSRYFAIIIQVPAGANQFFIGAIMIGLSWSAKWGQEMGAGRFIEDASTVERLFGGGFGIDEGAITGGYQWTFGDLQNDEIRTLYQTIKGLGTSRTLLVVEDPEQTDGLNERIHWGVLSKIEAYERVDPTNTKWGLSIRDWG